MPISNSKKKTAKSKALKAKSTKSKASGIGALAMSLIRGGKSNDEILKEIKRKVPKAKTTNGCINWYRTQLNKSKKVTA